MRPKRVMAYVRFSEAEDPSYNSFWVWRDKVIMKDKRQVKTWNIYSYSLSMYDTLTFDDAPFLFTLAFERSERGLFPEVINKLRKERAERLESKSLLDGIENVESQKSRSDKDLSMRKEKIYGIKVSKNIVEMFIKNKRVGSVTYRDAVAIIDMAKRARKRGKQTDVVNYLVRVLGKGR